MKMMYQHFSNGAEARLYDFRVNHVHDWESAWWVGNWILSHNSPAGHARSPEQQSYHQRAFHGPRNTLPLCRITILTAATQFEGELMNVLPVQFRNLVVFLATLRQELVDAYTLAEADRSQFNEQPFADDQLPQSFVTQLSALLQAAPDLKFHGFSDDGSNALQSGSSNEVLAEESHESAKTNVPRPSISRTSKLAPILEGESNSEGQKHQFKTSAKSKSSDDVESKMRCGEGANGSEMES